MREILFRGKRKDNGEWAYGYFIESVLKGSVFGHIKQSNTADDIKVYKKTVGQFTGLYDKNGKNGKKIFEGDIVRYADIYDYNCYLESLENEEAYEGCDYSDIWTVDEVVFCNAIGYPAFDLNSHDFETNGLSELIESGAWHYEVIGNIHDNPELLEGETE